MTTPTTDKIDQTIGDVIAKVREGLGALEGATAFAEAAMRIVEEALQAFRPTHAHVVAPHVEVEIVGPVADPGVSPPTLRP